MTCQRHELMSDGMFSDIDKACCYFIRSSLKYRWHFAPIALNAESQSYKYF